MQGIRVTAFAGEEKGAERRQVVFRYEVAVRILLAYRTESGRRREQGCDLVFRGDAPERAGVRCPHGLAFVEDSRVAVQQRSVDDVGMADDPAYVGCSPVDLARFDAVDVFHGPVQRDGVTAVVTNDALGLAGGA